MTDSSQSHWDEVYGSKSPSEVSWYEPTPERSLALIRRAGIAPTDPIIDVGAGASRLVDELLNAGYRDVTVLDVSAAALGSLRQRLGERAPMVRYLHQDITAFQPTRRYFLWHDRALFHFLTEPGERRGYLDALGAGLLPGGHVILATFGPAGPQRCSGLPVIRYDARSLAAELGSEFQLIDSFVAAHHTPSHAEQQFLYCHLRRTR